MALKLKAGLAYRPTHLKAIQKAEKKDTQPKAIKKLKLPRVEFDFSSIKEIFQSFAISALILMNLFLICFALVWFLLIFSFIQPSELVDMYRSGASSVLIDDSAGHSEIVNVPPEPTE